MSSHDSLGDRMKRYETASRTSLPQRMPVIVRVDGKAFHTLTRKMRKPFDPTFMAAMDQVAVRLCQELQGATLAYVQSDEVSVLLHGYRRHETQPWFDNQLQKMVSVSAALAAATMTLELGREAVFDSRAFVLPEQEVCNYFLWRQQDATRNSVQMVARSLYSDRECYKKSCHDLQEMVFQKGTNWNDLPTSQKRGRCVLRVVASVVDGVERHGWGVDYDIPIFSQNRDYVNRHLVTEPDEVDKSARAG